MATKNTSTTSAGGIESVDGRLVLHTANNEVPSDDPTAPSKEVSSRKQKFSDIFTIFCAGFALISDGYQNNLMVGG